MSAMDGIREVLTTAAVREMEPLVGVVIPCYNHGAHLAEAVESVLRQPGPPVEVVVVDDGSTDETRAVAAALLERHADRALTYLRQDNTGEPAVARNRGIARSRAPYILPLDADDYLDGRILAVFAHVLEALGGPDLVLYGHMHWFGEREDLWITDPFPPDMILRRLTVPTTALFDRRLWERHGGYRSMGYEDWEFWIGCAEQGARFVNLPEVVYHYRLLDGASRYKRDLLRHEWLVASIMRLHPDLYEDEDLEWATAYLGANPAPPDRREPHGPDAPFAWTRAMLVIGYPQHYSEEEIAWASAHLAEHPRRHERGVRRARCEPGWYGGAPPPCEVHGPARLGEALRTRGWGERAERYLAPCERIEIRRPLARPSGTVVLCADRPHAHLPEHMNVLRQQRAQGCEVICVDHSGGRQLEALRPLVNVYVKLSRSVAPGLARNVGAALARRGPLIFLDAAGVPHPKCLEGHLVAHRRHDVVAVRGALLGLGCASCEEFPRHYYLGDLPFPRPADADANVSYELETFFRAGGWDEELRRVGLGIDLALRILDAVPDPRRQIYAAEPRYHRESALDDPAVLARDPDAEADRARLARLHPRLVERLASWQPHAGRHEDLAPLAREGVAAGR
jgi:hypothetical protein